MNYKIQNIKKLSSARGGVGPGAGIGQVAGLAQQGAHAGHAVADDNFLIFCIL